MTLLLEPHPWDTVCYAVIMEVRPADRLKYDYIENLSVMGVGLTIQDAKRMAVNNLKLMRPGVKHLDYAMSMIFNADLDTGIRGVTRRMFGYSTIVVRHCDYKLYYYGSLMGCVGLKCEYNSKYIGHVACYLDRIPPEKVTGNRRSFESPNTKDDYITGAQRKPRRKRKNNGENQKRRGSTYRDVQKRG